MEGSRKKMFYPGGKTSMRRPYQKPMPNMKPPGEEMSIEDLVKKTIEKRQDHGAPNRIACKSTTTKYNPNVHPLVITYLKRDGADEDEICRVLGITRRTLGVWCSIHPEVDNAVNTSALGVCESVTRALYASAVGKEIVDVERVYEWRINPVTRAREKILAREKETRKQIQPNPLSCFFYLQNRDSSRWQPAGGRNDKTSLYTPEQVSAMLRTSASVMSDATMGLAMDGEG